MALVLPREPVPILSPIGRSFGRLAHKRSLPRWLAVSSVKASGTVTPKRPATFAACLNEAEHSSDKPFAAYAPRRVPAKTAPDDHNACALREAALGDHRISSWFN